MTALSLMSYFKETVKQLLFVMCLLECYKMVQVCVYSVCVTKKPGLPWCHPARDTEVCWPGQNNSYLMGMVLHQEP